MSKAFSFLVLLVLIGSFAAASCQRELAGAPCPCTSEKICCNGVCISKQVACSGLVQGESGGAVSEVETGGVSGLASAAGVRNSGGAGLASGGKAPSNGGTEAVSRGGSTSGGYAEHGSGGARPQSVAGTSSVSTGSSGGAPGKGGAAGELGDAGQGGAAGGDSEPPALVAPFYCSPDGWCGGNIGFAAAWGSAPDDVWFAGVSDTPVLIHGDGRSWSSYDLKAELGTGDAADLRTIWGSGKDDVWFAGNVVAHFGPEGFSQVPVYEATGEPATGVDFSAIWGSARDDVWALDGASHVAHFDGERWTRDPLDPDVELMGLWGSGRDDVWAIGAAGCILHFDGLAWSDCAERPSPTSASLVAISGSAADDVYVLSADQFLFHWDGLAWNSRDLHAIAGDAVTLLAHQGKVWIGTVGAIVGGSMAGEFSVFRPNPELNLVRNLWGFSDGEIWAPSGFNAIAHYDGSAWESLHRPNFTKHYLAAWTAKSSSSIWAVTSDSQSFDATIAHFDGSAWDTSLDWPGGELQAIWGTSDDDIWVGGATLLHRENGTWVDRGTPAFPVKALWGSSAHDVWAGAEGGALLHFSDGEFTAFPSSIHSDILSIWGSSPSDVWLTAAGDGPWHFDGSDWSWAPILIDGQLREARVVTGTSASDVWFVGAGKATHWNGATWSTFDEPRLGSRSASAGMTWSNAPCELWVLGGDDSPNVIGHFDGTGWQVERAGNAMWLSQIFGARDQVLAVGQLGLMLTRAPDPGATAGSDCTAPRPTDPFACRAGDEQSATQRCGIWPCSGSQTLSRSCGADGRFTPWTVGACEGPEPDCDPSTPLPCCSGGSTRSGASLQGQTCTVSCSI
jgi:hypothetical protein